MSKPKVGDRVRYIIPGDTEGGPNTLEGEVLEVYAPSDLLNYLVTDPNWRDEPWPLKADEILEILSSATETLPAPSE
jgi:hypothetical protein